MSELRRNDRNDPVVTSLADDPMVIEALNQRTQTQRKSMRTAIQAAFETEPKRLKGWVAVAIWEDEDGRSTQTVVSDDHSTTLEIKGMLHDAVWNAAHAE